MMSYWEDVRKEHVQIINSGHDEHGIWAEARMPIEGIDELLAPDASYIPHPKGPTAAQRLKDAYISQINPRFLPEDEKNANLVAMGIIPIIAIITAIFTDWALLWVYGPVAVLGMIGLLVLSREEKSGTTETWTSGEEHRS